MHLVNDTSVHQKVMIKPDAELQKKLFGEEKEMKMSIFEMTDFLVGNNNHVMMISNFENKIINQLHTAKYLFYSSLKKKRLL